VRHECLGMGNGNNGSIPAVPPASAARSTHGHAWTDCEMSNSDMDPGSTDSRSIVLSFFSAVTSHEMRAIHGVVEYTFGTNISSEKCTSAPRTVSIGVSLSSDSS
jgi:hypothetical protein